MTRRDPGRPDSSLSKASSMPFLPVVLDVGEADHVRGRFALGILAAVFLAQVHALHVQRHDLAGHRFVHLALEPDEVAVLVFQLLRELGGRQLQQFASLASFSWSRSTSSGIAQTLGAGTLVASSRPLRSRMRPRLAGSSSVRA
jgi:hypothetical protein